MLLDDVSHDCSEVILGCVKVDYSLLSVPARERCCWALFPAAVFPVALHTQADVSHVVCWALERATLCVGHESKSSSAGEPQLCMVADKNSYRFKCP